MIFETRKVPSVIDQTESKLEESWVWYLKQEGYQVYFNPTFTIFSLLFISSLEIYTIGWTLFTHNFWILGFEFLLSFIWKMYPTGNTKNMTNYTHQFSRFNKVFLLKGAGYFISFLNWNLFLFDMTLCAVFTASTPRRKGCSDKEPHSAWRSASSKVSLS